MSYLLNAGESEGGERWWRGRTRVRGRSPVPLCAQVCSGLGLESLHSADLPCSGLRFPAPNCPQAEGTRTRHPGRYSPTWPIRPSPALCRSPFFPARRFACSPHPSLFSLCFTLALIPPPSASTDSRPETSHSQSSPIIRCTATLGSKCRGTVHHRKPIAPTTTQASQRRRRRNNQVHRTARQISNRPEQSRAERRNQQPELTGQNPTLIPPPPTTCEMAPAPPIPARRLADPALLL